MLVDAFLGFDEIDLAEFRIEYLSDCVDKTYIFESRTTHSGIQKRLFFHEWYSDLDEKRKNKIEIIEIDLSHFNDAWEREIGSREFAMRFLRKTHARDFFILSDIDEIPSVKQVVNALNIPDLYHFRTPTFYRKINWALKDSHRHWSRGVIGEVDRAIYPNGARFTKSLPVIAEHPGAHLSYLGFDSIKLEKKLSSFAHTELLSASRDSKNIIQLSNEYGLDHLGRFMTKGFGLLEITKIEDNDVVDAASRWFPSEYTQVDSFKFGYFNRLLKSAKLTTYYAMNGEANIDNLPKYRVIITITKGLLIAMKRTALKFIVNQ